MNPKYQIVADALRNGIREGLYQKTLPTDDQFGKQGHNIKSHHTCSAPPSKSPGMGRT